MRNAGFLASKQQPTGSFVAPCPFHLLMAPPRNPDSGHRTFSQSKQMWDLTALLWGKTETGLFSRSLPIPFAYGTAQPHPSFVVAIEAFRLLGLILGGGANKSTGLGANKSKQPYYGEDLFAPPPKMGPRSGRKGWTCLPHPPRRAQEVAERPGLVCPAPRSGRQACGLVCPAPQEVAGRTGLVCPTPQKGPKKWPKGLDLFAPPEVALFALPPKKAQEVAERPGLLCPAPQHGPKKWPKGLDLIAPPPKIGPKSGRKAWTCFPHPQDGPKKWPKGLDLSKMDPRSGRKACAHSICLWHRPTTPLQDAPLQPKLTGLLVFLPTVRSQVCLLCEKVLWPGQACLAVRSHICLLCEKVL